MTPTTDQVVEELLLVWHLLGRRAQLVREIQVRLPDGTTLVVR